MDRKDLFDDLFSEREKHPLGKYEPENKKYKKETLPVKYSTPEAQKRLKKTFKKLRHKAIYLNMEHEELLEKFEEIRRQFIAKMLEYCDNKKIHHPFESVPDIKKNSNQLSNKEMNEVFREVVKQTHPDLNKNLSDDELNERVDMYNQVTEGKQNGDFRKILKVALELNIDIKKISPQIIDHLRKEIQNMWKQMQQIKNDVMYKWYESDEETRKTMFEIITKDLKPLDSSSDE